MSKIDFLFILVLVLILLSFAVTFLVSEETSIRLWSLLTDIGDERVYIFISIVLYFLYPNIGISLLLVILFSGMINFFIKWLFNLPRPPNPKILESGPSFPSNHAQSSATFWTMANFKFRSLYLMILGIVYTVFICYSRIVLNVHYPIDVIGGAIIGFIIALLFIHIPKNNKTKLFDNYTILFFLIFILSLVGYLIYKDENFASTSFFSLGFGVLHFFIKDKTKSQRTNIISIIIWIIVALPLLYLKSINLYLQYFLLGISAPLVKYLVYFLFK
jgi:membrane-associated phospholipid phosphatase